MDETGQTLKTGTVIDNKWVILEFIAKGGMGEVYRAHQLNLKRDVAIKVISREWLASLEDDQEEIEMGLLRFRNEVKAMAQVRHPNVLGIYDYGSFEIEEESGAGVLEYIVMEYVPGSTLRSTMPEEGFYPDEEATVKWLKKYFLPVLDGVEELHKFGTIHRDIKPENILIDRDAPKIADFGLARSCLLESVTQSIDMKGTPAYMAPEQFLDFKRTDERTDIYALGKILYEAIAGRIKPTALPFKSVGIENPDTEFFRALDSIIREATTEDKATRTKSVTDFREALLKAIENWENKRSHPTCVIDENRKKSLAKKIFVLSTVVGAVILVALYWFGHALFNHPNIHSTSSTSETINETVKKPGEQKKVAFKLPKIIEGKDGAKLRLVPEGMLRVSANRGISGTERIEVPAFYLDETQVTNHQFVDFLNSILSEITVEQGVVKKGDEVLYLLGEVKEGYEPVIYRNGRFLISNPSHASCPVVRVSALGAEAYARYYGRRLPTAVEWMYAYTSGMLSPQKTDTRKNSSQGTTWENTTQTPMHHMEMHMEMMNNVVPRKAAEVPKTPEKIPFPTPVLLYPPNRYGIRGLNVNISEWAQGGSKGISSEFVIVGNAINPSRENQGLGKPLRREPWEAFEEVGFRCALDVETYLKNP